MNEGRTMSCDDGAQRRVTDDADDQRSEPHPETEDPPPEEDGYGYGV